MSGNFQVNPLYQGQGGGGVNPLYQGPSHKYPSQVIVQFLEGDPGDHTITRGSAALDKHGKDLGIASVVVPMRKSGGLFRNFSKHDKEALAKAMGRISTLSRVYLRGHGDWESQKIGAWGAKDVADLLAECGMPAVQVVSVTGCELGRDKGTANTARIGASVNSFGSHFHARLGDKHGIYTVVYARVLCVKIGNEEEQHAVDEIGVKYTFNQDDKMPSRADGRHRANSKVKFWWHNSQQQRSVL